MTPNITSLKTFAFKPLLLTACFLFSTTAWADDISSTILELGTTDVPWDEDNLSTFELTSSKYNPTYVLNDYGATLSSRNVTMEALTTISPAENSVITIEATWLGMFNVGAYLSSGSGSYFRFGNIYIIDNDANKSSAYSLSGFSESNITYTKFEGPDGYRNYDPTTRPFYIIKMQVNTATNVLNYLYVYSTDDEETALLSLENQTLTDPNYTDIAFGNSHTTSNQYISTNDQVEILQSIKVTELAPAADYVINYVDEDGKPIKTSSTQSGKIGAAPTLSDSDTEDYVNDDFVKYIYLSNNADDLTIVSENDDSYPTEVTVTYRLAQSYDYSVVQSYSSSTSLLTSGSTYEDETISGSYPQYLLADNTLYVADPTDDSYLYSYVISSQDQENIISYSEALLDVVFYSEAEAIDGYTSVYSPSCSDASGAYNLEDVTITTLPAGTYVLTAQILGTEDQPFEFFTYNEETTSSSTILSLSSTSGTLTSSSSATFTVADNTLVIASITDTSTDLLDLVYIQSVSTPTAVSPVDASSPISSDAIYTLSGIRVTNPSKGLYTSNGKLILIK